MYLTSVARHPSTADPNELREGLASTEHHASWDHDEESLTGVNAAKSKVTDSRSPAMIDPVKIKYTLLP
jgi:hypothetical protein